MNPVVDTDQDPRIERSRRIILEAALEELGQVGYGLLTIEGVAARAGVGKSTIYRHWPGKLALVEDAFLTLKQVAEVPLTGTLRERLTGFLEQLAGLVEASIYSACMPALIDAAERDPQVRAFHLRFSSDRRDIVIGLLRTGVDSGELPPGANPELLADALVGPILLRRLMLHAPMDPKLARELVDQVLPATK